MMTCSNSFARFLFSWTALAFFSESWAKTTIRILPLGDSITWGYGGFSGSGYRVPLLEFLTNSSSPFRPPNTNITYIGTVLSGNLTPPMNANEGHAGADIALITEQAKTPLSWNGTNGHERGDVVLLMAGTNDMYTNASAAGASDRLGVLIDEIVDAWPDAAVLVSNLTPAINDKFHDSDIFNVTEANIVEYNAQVPGVVSKRAAEGKRVLFVPFVNVTVLDLFDGLHPNDAGYTIMANAWYNGMVEAKKKGWIGGIQSSGLRVEMVWISVIAALILSLAAGALWQGQKRSRNGWKLLQTSV